MTQVEHMLNLSYIAGWSMEIWNCLYVLEYPANIKEILVNEGPEGEIKPKQDKTVG